MISRILIFLLLITGGVCAYNIESISQQNTPYESTLPKTSTVYVTKTGKKYHKKGCHHLKSSIPISIDDAHSMGYDPCKVCCPGYP